MAHALLSPSSASRWLACTPSARLEAKFPDKAGEAAAEGTLAHALGELMLKRHLKLILKREYDKQLAAIKADPLWQDEMLEYMDGYKTYVIEQYSKAQAHTPDAMVFLEEKLDLTVFVPEGFGTGDCIIIADGVLEIIDYKHGKGVPVYADNNSQMKLYALGALIKFGILYDVHKIKMTIYQPRIDNISTFEVIVHELFDWADYVLKPKAKQAFNGEGEYVAGDHCRFCKASGQCKALAEFNLKLVENIQDPDLLSPEETAKVLTQQDMFVKWINGVAEYAFTKALEGVKWPGFKLVEGRSNRAYTDEDSVAQVLLGKGLTEDKVYQPRKVLGITAMEKELGKSDFALLLNDYVIKPPGKPTLVPESDKRAELTNGVTVEAAFEGIIIQD